MMSLYSADSSSSTWSSVVASSTAERGADAGAVPESGGSGSIAAESIASGSHSPESHGPALHAESAATESVGSGSIASGSHTSESHAAALHAAPAEPAEPAVAPVRRVSLTALRELLEDPLQAWGKHCLGLRVEPEAGGLALEQEPLACDALTTTVLLRDAFWEAVAQASGAAPARELLEDCYEQRLRRGELAGDLPSGVFLRVQRRRHLSVLNAWTQNLGRPEAGVSLRGLERVRFGAALHAAAADVVVAPLELEVALGGADEPPTRVLLHGATDLLLAGRAGSVQLIVGKAAAARHLARAHVQHLALAAAGLAPDARFRAVICPGSYAYLESRKRYRALAPLAPDEARAALAALACALLGGPHDYRLPLDPALRFVEAERRGGDPPTPLGAAITAGDGGAFGRASYGPIPNPERFAPPPDAEDLARERLLPLVGRLLEPPGARS